MTFCGMKDNSYSWYILLVSVVNVQDPKESIFRNLSDGQTHLGKIVFDNSG